MMRALTDWAWARMVPYVADDKKIISRHLLPAKYLKTKLSEKLAA